MTRGETVAVAIATVIGIGGFIAVVRAAWRELRPARPAEPGCVNVSDVTVDQQLDETAGTVE
jgi:hypothetical protein